MNVNDITVSVDAGGQDRLAMIFNRQRELMEKYHHIEKASGLLQTEDCPVNLHDARGQARLKDFAWRVTEELGETFDALEREHDTDHIHEEIADAFHFLVEMAILGGLTPEDVYILNHNPNNTTPKDTLEELFLIDYSTHENDFQRDFTAFMMALSMTCHTLKNKPWKQSQMLTDTATFKLRMAHCFSYFCQFARSMDMADYDLFDLYFKKSEVNRFRQRSAY